MQASDPHDRVFALRALVFDSKAAELRPKYECDMAELWRRVAIYVLGTSSQPSNRGKRHSSLMLALPSTQRNTGASDSILPSWVPDFTAWSDSSNRKDLFYTRESYVHCAGGGNAFAPLHTAAQPDVLHILGFLLTRVRSVLQHSSCPYQSRKVSSDKTFHDNLISEWISWYIRCRDFIAPTSEGNRDSNIEDILAPTQGTLINTRASRRTPEYEELYVCFERILAEKPEYRGGLDFNSSEIFESLCFVLRPEAELSHLDTTRVLATSVRWTRGMGASVSGIWRLRLPDSRCSGPVCCPLKRGQLLQYYWGRLHRWYNEWRGMA